MLAILSGAFMPEYFRAAPSNAKRALERGLKYRPRKKWVIESGTVRSIAVKADIQKNSRGIPRVVDDSTRYLVPELYDEIPVSELYRTERAAKAAMARMKLKKAK